uniref:Trefoil factor 2 n=1 Tax=Pseudonaja textilis TaxID=8673 RepID=A0A670YW91_PSETE
AMWFGIILLLLKRQHQSKCRCDVDPHKRTNCGAPGITPQECENSGCCFSSTVPGVPWCFKPTPPKYRKVCPADVKLRKNCGYPGISANECARRKCCFESKPPGVPWCFFHIFAEEGKNKCWFCPFHIFAEEGKNKCWFCPFHECNNLL